jgi:hypothetical protein
MAAPDSDARQSGDDADGVTREALDAVMDEVPKGALALSALTVGLLMLAYFLIYFFVFVPRGTVG